MLLLMNRTEPSTRQNCRPLGCMLLALPRMLLGSFAELQHWPEALRPDAGYDWFGGLASNVYALFEPTCVGQMPPRLMKLFWLTTARSPMKNVLLVPSVTSTIRVLRLASPES